MNRQWILKSRPSGAFKPENFELKEAAISEIQENQALIKTLYLSFDPTQRIWSSIDSYMPITPLGEPMRAIGLAQVIESKNKNFKKGDLVVGLSGWQEYRIIDASDQFNVIPPYIPLKRILPLIASPIARQNT